MNDGLPETDFRDEKRLSPGLLPVVDDGALEAELEREFKLLASKLPELTSGPDFEGYRVDDNGLPEPAFYDAYPDPTAADVGGQIRSAVDQAVKHVAVICAEIERRQSLREVAAGDRMVDLEEPAKLDRKLNAFAETGLQQQDAMAVLEPMITALEVLEQSRDCYDNYERFLGRVMEASQRAGVEADLPSADALGLVSESRIKRVQAIMRGAERALKSASYGANEQGFLRDTPGLGAIDPDETERSDRDV